MVSRTMTNLKDDLQENTFLGVLMNDRLQRIVAIQSQISATSCIHYMIFVLQH